MVDSKIVFTFNNYNLIRNSLDCISLDKKSVINTISPNSYGLAVRDKIMDKALKESDYLILDGIYFGWLPLLKYAQRIKRITGWDSFLYFSRKIQEKKGRSFFLGSNDSTLQKIEKRYKKDFSNIKVASYCPPFREEFTKEENLMMHQIINEFKPDVLFVGMTAPKQEKWVYQNKDFLDVHIITTIGNVFDWYAGNSKRPNIFWQKTGMEWLVRIFIRPEIFKRNIGNQLLFFWHLFLILINVKKI
jgi:N-acetylglucosaminyldiphosphoundecaprenol N-acetyl-beta-D-mannosaminyltransferase